jgi:hypothetical protein
LQHDTEEGRIQLRDKQKEECLLLTARKQFPHSLLIMAQSANKQSIRSSRTVPGVASLSKTDRIVTYWRNSLADSSRMDIDPEKSGK